MRPSKPIRNLKGETALPPGADLRCNKCERVKDDREATPKLLHLQYPSLGDSSVLEARKFFAQELIVRLVRAWPCQYRRRKIANKSFNSNNLAQWANLRRLPNFVHCAGYCRPKIKLEQ